MSQKKPNISEFTASLKRIKRQTERLASERHVPYEPALLTEENRDRSAPQKKAQHSGHSSRHTSEDLFTLDEKALSTYLQKQTVREARLILLQGMLLNHLKMGAGLRLLRTIVFKMTQTEYARFVCVGRKTLSDIENDRGNFSMETMNRIFKPLGFKMGTVPIATELWSELF